MKKCKGLSIGLIIPALCLWWGLAHIMPLSHLPKEGNRNSWLTFKFGILQLWTNLKWSLWRWFIFKHVDFNLFMKQAWLSTVKWHNARFYTLFFNIYALSLCLAIPTAFVTSHLFTRILLKNSTLLQICLSFHVLWSCIYTYSFISYSLAVEGNTPCSLVIRLAHSLTRYKSSSGNWCWNNINQLISSQIANTVSEVNIKMRQRQPLDLSV